MAKKKASKSQSAIKFTSKHRRRCRSDSPSLSNFNVFAPLASLISNHDDLAAVAIDLVGWEKVKTMLPTCLQGRSRKDVILIVADELDRMSKRRITRVLNGEMVSFDTSSSELSGGDSCEDARRPYRSSEPNVQHSTMSSSCEDNIGSISHILEGNEKKDALEYFSDVELAEGLDLELENLPDVKKT